MSALAAKIAAGVVLLVIGVAVWFSSVRDKSRELDVALEVLLDSDPGDDDAEPEAADPVALTPAEVLAMTSGQIAAMLQPLDAATNWSIHPALQRKPRPYRRDPFDFFADGGM